MHIRKNPSEQIRVEVVKQPLIVPPTPPIVVKRNGGTVVLNVNGLEISLSTYHAHRIGLAIGTADIAPDEMVRMTVNGAQIDLIDPKNDPMEANPYYLKVAGALLLKADAADDYQLQTKRKIPC